MAQRAADDLARMLRPREHVDYFGGEGSEEEIDNVEEEDSVNSENDASDFESEDESSDSKSEIESPNKPRRRRKYIYGKDKYKWCLTSPETHCQRSNRLVIHFPGVKGPGISARSPYELWNLLFSNEILEIILKHTNAEIERHRKAENLKNAGATFHNLTLNELKAFIGLLYFSGVQKNSNVTVSEMWSNEFGSTLYKVTMSQRRFEFIAARLRFDDRNTRSERRATDGLAPVREIWDLFINNCISNYTPSQNVTIDEQLLGFRGRFSAKVYIKSTPARYGIKIVCLNDAQTYYMFNAIPYTGKVLNEQGESVPTYYIRTLCQPIYNSGRNITCDNWFTSIELFNKMSQQFNLSMVGTIRKNKLQIPDTFKRNALPGVTRYGYDGNNILLSFCPKKNKVVLVLSSLHKIGKTSQDSDKPEIIEFYNKTKNGTDIFDQLCSTYTCARKTNRWPMRMFMGMLDQAGVNSCILYNFLPNNETHTRRMFLKNLALQLVTPHLRDRAAKPGLQKSISLNIATILSESANITPTTLGSDKMNKRKRCFYCETERDRKTQFCCVRCTKPICEDHRLICCANLLCLE